MWLITMRGLSGCGKSAVSRALGKQLGCPVIAMDHPIYDPRIIVDTIRPLNEIVVEIVQWLRQLSKIEQ